jgi:hypothetical protein
MPQIHFSVSEETKNALETKAKSRGLSLTKFLAEMAEKEAGGKGWPEGYFENVFGKWQGDLERPEQLNWTEREGL